MVATKQDSEQDKESEVRIPTRAGAILGLLTIPENAWGTVLFAHGSGSSRLSERNRSVAKALNDAGMATLLMDLLTEREASHREEVFNIDLLAGRLEEAAHWIEQHETLGSLPLGLFGASTGAAAALQTAAHLKGRIGAVVSRGGRPDLAEKNLARVTAPTLLIVGGNDPDVAALNRRAYAHLSCIKDLATVLGATHLFSEPGALEEVAAMAVEWFTRHMRLE